MKFCAVLQKFFLFGLAIVAAVSADVAHLPLNGYSYPAQPAQFALPTSKYLPPPPAHVEVAPIAHEVAPIVHHPAPVVSEISNLGVMKRLTITCKNQTRTFMIDRRHSSNHMLLLFPIHTICFSKQYKFIIALDF